MTGYDIFLLESNGNKKVSSKHLLSDIKNRMSRMDQKLKIIASNVTLFWKFFNIASLCHAMINCRITYALHCMGRTNICLLQVSGRRREGKRGCGFFGKTMLH